VLVLKVKVVGSVTGAGSVQATCEWGVVYVLSGLQGRFRVE
jgi:hypothetical protein